MKQYICLIITLMCFFKMNCQAFDSLKVITKNQLKLNDKKKVIYFDIKKDTISKYTITRIDSVNNFYFIYAKNDKYRYKIKSNKVNCDCKEKIEVGKVYQFDLRNEFDINSRIHIDDSAAFLLGTSCELISANDLKCSEEIKYYELSDRKKLKYDIKIAKGNRSILYNFNNYLPFNIALNLKGLCIIEKK